LSPNAFKGKIYVMINGGSFSASSLISSNLKLKRVTFVGEETGGAFNGTVWIYACRRTTHSELK
jgi:C-terminal processing protease CtpA/Prc